MTKEQFDKIVQTEILPHCLELLEKKGSAYTTDLDRLGNFKKNSKLLGITPFQSWFTFFMKHFDAITNYINGKYDDPEPIETRIEDLINYSILLYCLIKEKKYEKRTN